MKVQELIKKLSALNPTMEIGITDGEGYTDLDLIITKLKGSIFDEMFAQSGSGNISFYEIHSENEE